MARRARQDVQNVKPDMTPMMDVCFQLIIFFVLLMTLAKDENAQKVKLPIAGTPPIIEDDLVPNSLNINVDPDAKLWGWGQVIDLRTPAGLEQLRALMHNESLFFKEEQKQAGKDWRADGLETTLIVRVSQSVEFDIFRKVMDIGREMGFNKFQLKALPEEKSNASSKG